MALSFPDNPWTAGGVDDLIARIRANTIHVNARDTTYKTTSISRAAYANYGEGVRQLLMLGADVALANTDQYPFRTHVLEANHSSAACGALLGLRAKARTAADERLLAEILANNAVLAAVIIHLNGIAARSDAEHNLMQELLRVPAAERAAVQTVCKKSCKTAQDADLMCRFLAKSVKSPKDEAVVHEMCNELGTLACILNRLNQGDASLGTAVDSELLVGVMLYLSNRASPSPGETVALKLLLEDIVASVNVAGYLTAKASLSAAEQALKDRLLGLPQVQLALMDAIHKSTSPSPTQQALLDRLIDQWWISDAATAIREHPTRRELQQLQQAQREIESLTASITAATQARNESVAEITRLKAEIARLQAEVARVQAVCEGLRLELSSGTNFPSHLPPEEADVDVLCESNVSENKDMITSAVAQLKTLLERIPAAGVNVSVYRYRMAVEGDHLRVVETCTSENAEEVLQAYCASDAIRAMWQTILECHREVFAVESFGTFNWEDTLSRRVLSIAISDLEKIPLRSSPPLVYHGALASRRLIKLCQKLEQLICSGRQGKICSTLAALCDRNALFSADAAFLLEKLRVPTAAAFEPAPEGGK